MRKWILSIALVAWSFSEAQLTLTEFKNDSDLKFNPTFCDGTPIQGALLDGPETCLWAEEGEFGIVFEDAGCSGFYRPERKFNIWLESDDGFQYFDANRILYAVVFYDGEAEVALHFDARRKVHVEALSGVKDVVYPWAKGTIGPGNPYHEVDAEIDENGIKYRDYSGYVGYPEASSLKER